MGERRCGQAAIGSTGREPGIIDSRLGGWSGWAASPDPSVSFFPAWSQRAAAPPDRPLRATRVNPKPRGWGAWDSGPGPSTARENMI